MPSIYEMTSYFSRDSERQCHATAYARAAGVSNNGYIFYKGDPIDTMDDTVQPMIRIQLSSSCNHNWLPASSTYSDGSSITCTLLDTMQLQTIVLSDFIATNSLRITINSVYPSTDYADIGISDVFLLPAINPVRIKKGCLSAAQHNYYSINFPKRIEIFIWIPYNLCIARKRLYISGKLSILKIQYKKGIIKAQKGVSPMIM